MRQIDELTADAAGQRRTRETRTDVRGNLGNRARPRVGALAAIR
jgi:hypothetical protein